MSNYEDRYLKVVKPFDEFIKQVMKEQPEAADEVESFFGSWAYDGLQDVMTRIDNGEYEGGNDE